MLGSLFDRRLLVEVGELEGDLEEPEDLLDAVLVVEAVLDDSEGEQSRLEAHNEGAL